MDDDVLQDLFNQALGTGFENLALLQLAAAWCQNIGDTKGPLGTGMVEQITGLPISGGSLRCDYAKAPTMFGMGLEHTALDFYEQNCIGCSHRKPTDATEHLGTWADALIAERDEQCRQQEEAHRQAVEARQRRHKERRLLLGAPDVTLQSILDLIDRIDAEAHDPEAERLLLSHAEMAPGDFPDELVDHMTNESTAIGNDALLKSVIAIFDRQGRPATDRMLKVAFDAVGRDVAAAAAGRVIAVHAKSFDVDGRSLDGVVLLAAGRKDSSGRPYGVGAEPAPLIHLYDLDPERAVQLIGAKLGDEEIGWRAKAAQAADKLVGARPEAVPRLLPALLDAIKFPDKSFYLGDPFAAAQARNVVANILEGDPASTAREIDARMQTANVAYARELWRCYDSASRGRLREPLAKDVAEVIATRGMSLLRQDLDPTFLREVSDTLGLTARYHGDSLELSLPDVVALVLFWADRIEAYKTSKPSTEIAATPDEAMLAFFNSESKGIKLNAVLTNLRKVLEACAARRPKDYVELLTGAVWTGCASSGGGRVLLLDVLGSVIREQALLDRAEPLLFGALESNCTGERAASLRAFAEIGHHEVILPGGLPDCVLAALLEDDNLIVALAAIRALGLVEVPAERKPEVINYLLHFARAYGPERLYSDDVDRTVWRVLHLAKSEPYEERAAGLMLEVIGAFPSAQSAELLARLPLEYHAGWPAAAVRALHLDPDPNYYGIRDYDRQNLLLRLAELPTNQLAPLFDELEKVGLERLPHDRTWAWAISDVLAYHQQHERAAAICDAVVAVLPDTREQRPARRFARQIALGRHLDGATIKGDAEARERMLQEWEQLVGETED